MASRIAPRITDHRITVRHRVTPAASISSRARSPSPGSRSTAAIASVRTAVAKPSADRVDGGRLDAVVGGEPGDDDGVDAGVAQEALELGRDGLAGHGVAHREARVAVLAVDALADPRRVIGECQIGVELRAPRVRDAVDRPDAAVLGEMRRDGGCQSWVATTIAPLVRAISISRSIAGMIAVPPATDRPPAGSAKSFWTSTTMRAVPGR